MPSKGSKRNDPRPDRRGNSTGRRVRRQWLITTFGNGVTVRCHLGVTSKCLRILTIDTVTADRHPIPGRDGGTYRRGNIRPACKPCQDHQGAHFKAGG